MLSELASLSRQGHTAKDHIADFLGSSSEFHTVKIISYFHTPLKEG